MMEESTRTNFEHSRDSWAFTALNSRGSWVEMTDVGGGGQGSGVHARGS